MEKQNQIPEAVSSVTYSVTRNGFPILFTVRDSSGGELIKKMDAIEESLKERGYTGQVRASGGGFPKKEPVYADYQCPTCGEKVVKETTKTGKNLEKCSTNKWVNGAAQGCSYIKWL